jgi:uncharacterized protein (DUF736 family)
MRVAICIILFAVVTSCQQQQHEKPKDEEVAKDTISFFQVNDYIQSEITEVNRTPYFIYRIDVNNGTKDSSAIDNNIFNQLARHFLEVNINDPALKKKYTENVFHDQTTKSYTLSYTTADKELPVQSIDVLLNEDAQTVKRVFIRKFISYGDSSAIEQLSWKPHERFQINRLVQSGGNKENLRETTVIWNDKQ